jgi:hypothetical protein
MPIRFVYPRGVLQLGSVVLVGNFRFQFTPLFLPFVTFGDGCGRAVTGCFEGFVFFL